MKLAGLQTARIAAALAELGPNAHEAARRFLVTMIDPTTATACCGSLRAPTGARAPSVS